MTKKKMRKGKQLSLTNPKNAGRPAIHDKGIRHRKREELEDIGAYIFKYFQREYFEFKDMLDCLRIYERELRFVS